jgi:hypothetical protein
VALPKQALVCDQTISKSIDRDVPLRERRASENLLLLDDKDSRCETGELADTEIRKPSKHLFVTDPNRVTTGCQGYPRGVFNTGVGGIARDEGFEIALAERTND